MALTAVICQDEAKTVPTNLTISHLISVPIPAVASSPSSSTAAATAVVPGPAASAAAAAHLVLLLLDVRRWVAEERAAAATASRGRAVAVAARGCARKGHLAARGEKRDGIQSLYFRNGSRTVLLIS